MKAASTALNESGKSIGTLKAGQLVHIYKTAKKKGDSAYNYYYVGYGSGKKCYVLKSNVEKYTPSSSNSKITFAKVNVGGNNTLKQGEAKNINGVVTSKLPIAYVQGTLGGQKVGYRIPDTITTSVNIKDTIINQNIKCGKLSAGTQTLQITAWDISGTKVAATPVSVTVNGDVKAPSITVKDAENGKTAVIKQNESGGVLYYSTGGTESHTDKSSISVPVTKSLTITAYTKKNNKNSTKIKQAITISQLGEPAINVTQKGKTANITIKAADSKDTVMYKIDNGKYAKYNGKAFDLNDGATVYAYSQRNGYIKSEVSQFTAELSEPDTPKLKINGGDENVAVGKSITVNCAKDTRAEKYVFTLYKEDGSKVNEVETTTATATFSITEAGEYYITAIATNGIGDSDESEGLHVSGREPLTVRFYNSDYDMDDDGNITGTVLDEVSVRYGESPEKVAEPSKKGHTFVGWKNASTEVTSTDAYLKSAVKSDMAYVAQYSKNKYKVKLYDTDGSLLDTQTVAYGDAVNIDGAAVTIPENYKFAGWQVTQTSAKDSLADITNVDCDMEVHAVATWANKDLPVAANVTKAEQSSDGKYINAEIQLSNNEEEDLSFYLVAALKAVDDSSGTEKTVYADRKIVYLDAGDSNGTNEKTVTMKLPNAGSGISKLEVVAVQCNKDMSTGSTYSNAAWRNVTISHNYTDWSEWSTEVPTNVDGRLTESKTQTRYRDKQYAYSGKDTLSGYTKLSTETVSTKYGSWVFTKPTASTTTTDANKTVVSVEQITAQRSYAYVSGNKDWYWTNTGGTSKSGQKTSNLLTVYSSKSLSASGYSKDSSDGSYALPKTISTTSPGKMGTVYRVDYAGSKTDTYTSGVANTWLWPHSDKTRIIYRTKTVVTRNKFWKWGEYSDWSDASTTASSEREVQTRTVYRYMDQQDETAGAVVLDPNGDLTRTFSGRIDVESDLNGKKAAIMVYQVNNTDPNKYQMQYLGETTIGENNSYEFSFIPKDEPTVESGNYIVTLGVEGSTGLITVGLVEAPKAKHTVSIYYDDAEGNAVDLLPESETKSKFDHTKNFNTITVTDGEDIDLSTIEIPERDGFYFAGWSRNTTNITETCEIKAVYVPVMNTIVTVDWVTQEVDMTSALGGDIITLPEGTEEIEGYTFKGWKAEDGTLYESGAEYTVSGNAILEAEYDVATYTVTFLDVNGDVVGEPQTVKAGESADPPEYTAPEGKGTFVSWSTRTNWWSVSSDVEVRPIVVYDESALAPTASIAPDEEDASKRVLTLETEEEDAEIYYTTNGEAPTSEMIEEARANGMEEMPEEGISSEKGETTVLKYTGPLTFTESTPVIAISYVDGKNPSEPCETYYDAESDLEAIEFETYYEDEIEISTQEIKAAPGSDVTVDVSLTENPGLSGYEVRVYGDTEVFYADTDEYDEPVVTTGEVPSDGDISTSSMVDGWKMMWLSTEAETSTGRMFSMNLHVEENAETGMYPITVTYVPESTLDAEYEPVALDSVKVSVSSAASTKLDTLNISLSRDSYEYEGSELKPAVNIEGLKEGEDYTVTYESNINVGTGKAIITGIGDYEGTVEKEFTITQANIANAEIAEIPEQIATGEAMEPELSVSYNGVALEKGVDYEAAYSNNTEVGTAAVTLTGIGNFKGSKQAEFEITESLEQLLEQALADKAKAEKEAEDAKAAKEAAQSQVDELQSSLDAANAEIENLQQAIDEGLANLTEQLEEANRNKTDLENQLNEANYAKEEAEGRLEEANKAKEDAEKRAEDAEKALEEYKQQQSGSDSGDGSGGGSQTQPGQSSEQSQSKESIKTDLPAVKIVKPAAAKKAVTVKWKKVSKANQKKIAKIQIQYSTDKTFKTGVKTTTAKKSAASKKIKKLASKKTYYVRVRAYKKIGDVTHVSKWSAVKKVKAK